MLTRIVLRPRLPLRNYFIALIRARRRWRRLFLSGPGRTSGALAVTASSRAYSDVRVTSGSRRKSRQFVRTFSDAMSGVLLGIALGRPRTP